MSSIAPYFVSQIQHGFPLSTGFNDAPLVNTDMDNVVQCLELLFWNVSLCNESLPPGYTASYPTKQCC